MAATWCPLSVVLLAIGMVSLSVAAAAEAARAVEPSCQSHSRDYFRLASELSRPRTCAAEGIEPTIARKMEEHDQIAGDVTGEDSRAGAPPPSEMTAEPTGREEAGDEESSRSPPVIVVLEESGEGEVAARDSEAVEKAATAASVDEEREGDDEGEGHAWRGGRWRSRSDRLFSGFLWDLFDSEAQPVVSSWEEAPTDEVDELEEAAGVAQELACSRRSFVSELLGVCPVQVEAGQEQSSHLALAAALELIADTEAEEAEAEESAMLISPRHVWTEQLLERVANATATAISDANGHENHTVLHEVDSANTTRPTADADDDGELEEAPDEEEAPKDVKWLVRFNYASEECGANILSSSATMKGSANVLTSSKDAYLLAECAADKWLVLELCEEINVEAVTMANMEFFSSSFKEFDVYHSDTSPAKEWHLLASFMAENVRAEQHFPVPRPAVTKYLKFVFREHYGREHYCPITSLKVFGSTLVEGLKEHLEADSKSAAKTIHAILSQHDDPAPSAPAGGAPAVETSPAADWGFFGNYEEYCENTNVLSSITADQTLRSVNHQVEEALRLPASTSSSDEEPVNVFTQLARRLSAQEMDHSLLSGYMDDFVQKITQRFNELKANSTRLRKKDQSTIKILSNVTAALLEENTKQQREIDEVTALVSDLVGRFGRQQEELLGKFNREKSQNQLYMLVLSAISVVVSVVATIVVLSVLAHLQQSRVRKRPRGAARRRYSASYSPPASPEPYRGGGTGDGAQDRRALLQKTQTEPAVKFEGKVSSLELPAVARDPLCDGMPVPRPLSARSVSTPRL